VSATGIATKRKAFVRTAVCAWTEVMVNQSTSDAISATWRDPCRLPVMFPPVRECLMRMMTWSLLRLLPMGRADSRKPPKILQAKVPGVVISNCQPRALSRLFSTPVTAPMSLPIHQRRRFCVGLLACAALLSCLAPSNAIAAAKPKKSEKAPGITFSPRGGVFGSNVTVQLTAKGNAPIHFSLDGSEPTGNSPVYSGAIVITNTAVLRARTWSKNEPGDIAAEVYTLLDEDLANFTSNLPLGILNAFGSNVVKERKAEGTLQFVDGGEARTKLSSSPVTHSGRALLNLRGRASLRYPKAAYTVKTIDGDGDSADAPLLGMPADADWVLYAPYPDKTLLRDVVAYELFRDLGRWAPRTRLVELFVSDGRAKLGKANYVGVYVVIERLKRADQRVPIKKLRPEDDSEPRITGGWIFKKDHVDSAGFAMGGEFGGPEHASTSTRAGFPTAPGGFPADPRGFLPPATRTTSRSSSSSSSSSAKPVITNHLGFAETRLPSAASLDVVLREQSDGGEESFKTALRTNQFYFVEPEPDELTAVQKAWLKTHLNDVERTIYSDDFRDPAKGYAAFIDSASFIDYHLFVEATKNVDGFRFSVFYHKERGGKIKADPVWDWNLSFGNANGKQGWIPEHWLWPQLDDREYTWYRRLFEDPDFGQRYVDRWSELRTNVLATRRVLARIDELAAFLDEAQKRNFERWPILGRPINPNYFYGSTYAEEVEFMKKFIGTRLDWIEKQFVPVPKANAKEGKAELTAAAGEILFTLDGSDPRASGGAPAAKAQSYKGTIDLPPGAKLFARARFENRWSGPLVLARE
jgi:hypothetical protein